MRTKSKSWINPDADRFRLVLDNSGWVLYDAYTKVHWRESTVEAAMDKAAELVLEDIYEEVEKRR